MNKGDSVSATEISTNDTTHLKLAAAAIALDVPLDDRKQYTSASGSGINGTRTIIHFKGKSPQGDSFDVMAKAWYNEKWLSENPTHNLAIIKNAFEILHKMADHAKGLKPYVGKKGIGTSVSTASSIAAATLVSIGHPCIGYVNHMGSVFWHFNEAASGDLALWEDKQVHMKLPNLTLSYVKCALFNWVDLVKFSKEDGIYQAVQHNGKTAFVSKHDSKETINILDKLLHAK